MPLPVPPSPSLARRLALAASVLALPVALVVPLSPASAATTICVGAGAGCQPTLTAALDVAQDGDTVQLGPGTFPGGIVIERSITLAGAGADQTTISGGEHVVQVGRVLDPSPPTVTIKGVTLTGGFPRSLDPAYGFREPDAIAVGGGLWVPYAEDFEAGAAVTVVDTVITRNRVSPTKALLIPLDQLPCPGEGCRFAGSYGGGIETSGPLRLVRTTVSGNRIGSAAASDDPSSDAEGAGIDIDFTGSLTMVDSTVSDNTASVAAPNGRFAEGGGIFSAESPATITRSRITGNQALVRSSFPTDDLTYADSFPVAVGGGYRNTFEGSASITRSTISGNSTRNVNSSGASLAWAGGLQINGTLEMSRSVVSGNHVSAGSPSSTFGAFADGAGLELDGDFGDVNTIKNSSITGNTLHAVSGTGDVTLGGAGIYSAPLDPGSNALTDTQVSGNHATGSTRGNLDMYGAGVWNISGLDLVRTRVDGNQSDLRGGSGAARGGGLFVGRNAILPDIPATPRLSTTGGSVIGNLIRVRGGMTATGGGIFTEVAAMLVGTPVVRNSPDPQCEGCDGSAKDAVRSGVSTPALPHQRGPVAIPGFRR